MHQEDGEAVGGKNVVVERGRSGWIDVRRDHETGAGESRTGRREGKDGYCEKAAHL